MSGRNRLPAVAVLSVAAASLLAGCTDVRRAIGLEQVAPDEFAVESRAPLTIPPEFDLRPPQPGAPRPQEKSANQQARQAFERAGPGEPGKQASDSRLHQGEGGLTDLGPTGPGPDPNAAVGPSSLSNKLLGYDGADSANVAVEKRETSPLKGVY
jgi:hypothetical protein